MDLKWEFDDFKNFEKALVDNDFEKEMKEATEEISKEALKSIKTMTPVDTGKLKAGWGGNDCKANRTDTGFESDLVNEVHYSSHANDGHRVRNQPNGRYYKVKRRIKVPVASEYQRDTSDWYVFGHFFVEKGLKSTRPKLKRIVNRRLDKWWKERHK